MLKPKMTNELNLSGMESRHPALTAAIAAVYKEAATVCLSRHHVSPVKIALVDNGHYSEGNFSWSAPDQRTMNAWANEIDATEAGAYCCVIAGVEYVRGQVALRRAETGTGADYYIGDPGANADDLEDYIRLEISGVDKGDLDVIGARLRSKTEQAKRGESNLPAIAGVMGFAHKTLMISDVVEDK
jgi:hypothetical protein